MKALPLLIAAAAAFLASAAPASAALNPGDLDTRFATGGSLLLDPTLGAPRASRVRDVAIDAQGRVLVTGTGRDAAGKDAVFVQRLSADGAIDSSFGDNGVFIRQFGLGTVTAEAPFSTGVAIVAAPDGGVVVGMNRSGESGDYVISALKLTPQGRLDLDYGTSGLATITPAANKALDLRPGTGSVRPDGGVLFGVAEFDSSAFVSRATLAGFTANGQPGGITGGSSVGLGPAVGFSPAYTQLNRVASAGNTLLAVGLTDRPGGGNAGDGSQQGYLTRYTPQYTADTTFGGPGGMATLNFGHFTSGRAIATGPGGVIYVGSTSRASASSVLTTGHLTRFSASGQLDTSFGSGGTRNLQLAECDSGATDCGTQIYRLSVDGAGRIVAVGGSAANASKERIVIARFLPTGSLDKSFGTDGVAYGPAPTAASFTVSGGSAVQGTDRMVIGTITWTNNAQTSQAGVRRYTLDAVPDPTPVPTPTPVPEPAPTVLPVATLPPAAPTPPPASDTTKPALSKVGVKTTSKRVATATFTGSEAGTVTIELLREVSGRRKQGVCSAKAKSGPKCKVFAAYRTIKAPPALKSGANSISLGSALPAGKFQLRITAKDAAGNAAAPTTSTFTVKAAKK